MGARGLVVVLEEDLRGSVTRSTPSTRRDRGDGVPVGIHGRTLAQTASPSKTKDPPWTIVFSMDRVIVEPLGMSGV